MERLSYAEALEKLRAIYQPMTTTTPMTEHERAGWLNYQRWAPGPLGTREQWLAMHRLADSNWAAWRVLNGV